ncbi:ORF6N domain-containing protein [Niallia alba]|uniref:ORF6N domain-containing protein n=1 Tax=Niallia alba TaxID=2729105 RepID=UPI002E204401|nr:ORF6N domain-containing protein [Niallia alba]
MDLTIINHNNQRILTTAQLATSYQTENKVISNNFNRNKDRYKEGKHYFALTDESKRQFINLHQIEDGSKNANTLYLWTEKGAWLHAKSLNTDAAWDAYEKLVDEYYSVVKVLSEREQLIASMKLSLETAEEINHIKNDLDLVKHQVSEELTLNHGQQQSLHHEIKKRVESIKNHYEMTSREIYSQIHSHLRRAFAAPKYVFVKRKDFEEAVSWVKTWRPLV